MSTRRRAHANACHYMRVLLRLLYPAGDARLLLKVSLQTGTTAAAAVVVVAASCARAQRLLSIVGVA